MCQLQKLRPDLAIVPLRGNVDTRLRKLEAGEVDGMVVAVAGLSRLGHRERIDAVLSVADSLPAVGQGALALQCRADDQQTLARLQRLNHLPTSLTVKAERAFLIRLQGDCKTPLAGHAVLAGDDLVLDGLIGSPDGTQIVRGSARGPMEDAERLGTELADRLLGQGLT
jgi:hydroxymethylbilane synthase